MRSIWQVSISLVIVSILMANLALASVTQRRLQSEGQTRQSRTPSSSTDNWLGGPGMWSDPSNWSDGVPGFDSDVFIATGNDQVWLDLGSNVSSLTLGGANGSSTLNDDSGRDLNILGKLTVNPSGVVFLQSSGDLTSSDINNFGAIQIYDPRSYVIAQTLTNYTGSSFNLDFGHGQMSQVTNYGTVLVHNGLATLGVSGDLDNYYRISVALNANMNVAGTLTNYAAATLNVEGPGSYTTTGRLVNYGFINEILGGNLSTPILVNAGFIQTDQYSRIQVGTGKTGDPGYFQFSDGTLVEAIGADYFGVTAVNGGASINGTLSIFLKNGFVPELGAVYRFLYFTPGELSGEFSSIGNQYFNNGLEMWEITYDNRRGFVQLTAGPSPEPGSVLLLGGGLLAAASTVRRRLR